MEKEKKVKKESPDIVPMLQGIVESLSSLTSRMDKYDNKGNEFKEGITEEDIKSVASGRLNVDSRIVKIVDEMLGEDFGIEIEPNADKPGFLFTLVVPNRLSDVKISTRPVKDENGMYTKDQYGIVKEEEYLPEDRRSRQIGSHQSYDAIREHCDKVRAYIVSYFTKLSKPIPEFKVKSKE